MKKLGFFLLIGLLLSGCSYADITRLLATETPTVPPPTATATVYVTPSNTPSITPTQPTPTFTLTPTLIYPNGTPLPSATVTPMNTPYLQPKSISTTGSQPQVGNGPFASITVSGSQLLWGGCEPSSVRATVKVAPGVPAAVVTIWLRIQSVSTGETTAWGGGAIMDRKDNGNFTYTLTPANFEHYREFPKAWGQYQFVASDARLHRLGASGLFLNNLTISQCP
ncbi:MAG TPA: hypothetical protein VF784_05550 [Anaerolineales bacterium]